MTVLFQDGFDYNSRSVFESRGWTGSPFGFVTGRIVRPGYPSYAIKVIFNNDVSHDLPPFSAGIVGFGHKNVSQAPLWGDGGRIAWLYQTVAYYTCSCDHDCNCDVAFTYMLTGVGLDGVNRLYSFCYYPTFESCGGDCVCALKPTGHATAVIGTGDVLDFRVWNYIEFKVDGGLLGVHLNGGVNIVAGALPVLDPCASVGGYERITFSSPHLGSAQDIDDVYVSDLNGSTNNDFLGDVHIETLLPDADGTYQEWTPKTGSDHFAMVDESPPDDDATFNFAERAGARDSYSLLPLPSEVTTVFSVQANLDVKQGSAESKLGNVLVRQGGADYYSPRFDFPRGAYAYVSWLLDQDPTSADWLLATINGDEWGIRLETGGGGAGAVDDIQPSFVGRSTI